MVRQPRPAVQHNTTDAAVPAALPPAPTEDADAAEGDAPTAAVSLLDAALAQLAARTGDRRQIVEDLVVGLEVLGEHMTSEEWARFCSAAKEHRLQAVLTPGIASPRAAPTDPAGTHSSRGMPPAGAAAAAPAAMPGALSPPTAAPARAPSTPANGNGTPLTGHRGVEPAPLNHPALSVDAAGTSSQHATARASVVVPSTLSPASDHARTPLLQRSSSLPRYQALVFSGGGARCLAYMGAVHRLRQLGMLRELRAVSGSSGGAVFAVLAALGVTPPEVLDMMRSLPEKESVSWFNLNSRLGLTEGDATFTAITKAIALRLGVEDPTLGDVAAASGLTIHLAATSLSRRAPVYFSSATHGDLRLHDALRSSCAVPLYFSPVRVDGDFLVDGCLTDCSPIAALSSPSDCPLEGRWSVHPSRVLVLTVNDENQLDSDFQGLLHGLVATVMQAGWHRATGADTLQLWPAAASINPLQFRVPPELAREVVARSQTLAEEFAADKLAAAAHRPPPPPVPPPPAAAECACPLPMALATRSWDESLLHA